MRKEHAADRPIHDLVARHAHLIEDMTIRTIASKDQQDYQTTLNMRDGANADIAVRRSAITSLRTMDHHNLKVVARDIFATPNSLILQVWRESKSPFSNIHAVTSKLCSQSSQTATEIDSFPRIAVLKFQWRSQ